MKHHRPDSPDQIPTGEHTQVHLTHNAAELSAALNDTAATWAQQLAACPAQLEHMCGTILALWQMQAQLMHEMSLKGAPLPIGAKVIAEMLDAIIQDGGLSAEITFASTRKTP